MYVNQDACSKNKQTIIKLVGSSFHAGWERAAAALSPVPHDQN